MWSLTTIGLVFVVLRMYTRIFVVKSFGIDDHVYNIAFACLLFNTIFMTIGVHYGLGQNLVDILENDPDNLQPALIYEATSQTFAILGMSIAKWSLGLFLLRLVQERWHKVVIWLTMGCLMVASVALCFVYWFQCTPPRYLWDRSIPGRCTIDTSPSSLLLCILCMVADLFLSGFPWLFIWGLQMPRKEKIIILSSLSLGIFAGAFGIKRTLEVPKLKSPNHTKDPMGLIVWTAAEMTVTMICIGIPVCRPLWKQYLIKWTSRDSKSREPNSAGSFPLQTIGGSTPYPKPTYKRDELIDSDDVLREQDRKSGLRDSIAKARHYSNGIERAQNDNQSEEEILGSGFRRSQREDLEMQNGTNSVIFGVSTSEVSL
ncbi:integral membrane protein pth11 [Fusarium heterosporum]|uniref:Integral membrane protein pth11 n=1 Tax=Fusarium heterosporum TaxID=42747 RepID=A0A8H5SYT0_FUSHE|nr:integral membrane protein pth11 [Fusarium heterosporum]